MAKGQKPIYFSENSNVFSNLDILKRIYGIKTNTKLIEFLVNNDLKRISINIRKGIE